MKKVLVSRMLPEMAFQILGQTANVEADFRYMPDNKAELLKELRDTNGLLVLPQSVIDSEILNAAKKLEVISLIGVGYENINLEEASRKKFPWLTLQFPRNAWQNIPSL